MDDEAPKSAYEIAMARLRRKDADQGIEERPVSDAQKEQIAEVGRVYSSRVAEAEILYKSKLMALVDGDERNKLAEMHRRDLQRLHDDRERKLTKIRG